MVAVICCAVFAVHNVLVVGGVMMWNGFFVGVGVVAFVVVVVVDVIVVVVAVV
jgi:hypothetical protein